MKYLFKLFCLLTTCILSTKTNSTQQETTVEYYPISYVTSVNDLEPDEEDEYVQVYGNTNASGIWHEVRNISSDQDRLANISLQAHRRAGMANENDSIDAVLFDTRTLLFTKPQYKNMDIDMIIYSIERAPQNYLYIGKGMKPGCVHFLIRVDTKGTFFFFGKHVCKIII